MRVAFLLISHWSANLGGAEQQVKYLADYLSEYTEHELHYICRRTKTSLDGKMIVHTIGKVNGLGKYLKCVDHSSILEKLEEIMPDVVYTRVWSSYIAVASKFCKKYNKKLICHLAHQDDVEPLKIKKLRDLPKYVDRWFYEKGLANANYIIGQAAYQNELLKINYKLNCSLIIPNFHPLPENKITKDIEQKTIVWVANIKNFKQPDLYLKIVKHFKSKKVKFLMIGAINEERYREPIQATSLEASNFEYLGALSMEKVNEYLEKAYLFVNTSTAEGFPNTFIQSWLRKTPVVSLNVDPDGMIKEFGIGRHSKNFDQMLKDIEFLLENPSLQKDMGERAEDIAKKRFSTLNCKKIVELIEK
jgi:glycosyltransferase involved in cell wall biosynthesis